MPCEECRDLNTHEFRSAADLVHAVQVAATEVDRGVLERINVADRSLPEQAAIDSAFSSGTLPEVVQYRFRCTQCGDEFALSADIGTGEGKWTRETPA